jgi:ketosteroid isomerase-like protein
MVRNIVAPAVCVCLLAGASVGAQPRTLQPNTPTEGALAGKESHEYVVTSTGNQAFDVTAQQGGLDVVLTVFAPSGDQLMQVDSASDDQGRGGAEVAHVRALDAGAYRIQVALFDRSDHKPGKYSVTLSTVREMTAEEIDNARSEKEILALEARWEKAGDTTDIPTRDAILRKDGFALGPYSAASRGRTQIIASWENQAKERAKLGGTRTHTLSEHSIRVAGNAAVSTARYLISAKTKDNQASSFSGQFVHIWGRDKDGWKLVADYTFPFGRVPRGPATPPAVPADVLAAYAGTYSVEGAPTVIEITVEKGSLVGKWQRPGQPPFTLPLAPVNDTTFAAQGQDDVVFVRSAAGAVRELLLVGDGPAVRAIRKQ